MESRARVEAGRRNGLLAQTLIFANESSDRFEVMRQYCYEEWQSETEYEVGLVDLMVTNHWRINRTICVEKETIDLRQARMEHSGELKKEFDVIPEPVRLAIAFEKETNGPNTLDKIGRYETRFSRAMLRYAHELRDHRDRKNTFLRNEGNEGPC